ncbi:MAG: 50S ribosomal protein L29 [Deltaproteobacteria bacterium]|nr:50S ribosomal protein L29 [Candidatus Anaeroferrophillacea bacterium]
MKADELREMSPEELQGKYAELSQELFNLRFQKIGGQLHDTTSMRKIRRDRARVRTVLREQVSEA